MTDLALDTRPLDDFTVKVEAFAGDSYPAINDIPQYEAAAGELKHIKSLRADGSAALKAITDPLRQAEQKARELFRPVFDRLDGTERQIKDRMVDYDAAVEAERREREAAARALAEKERLRLARAAEKAEEAGRLEKAAGLEMQARAVPVPVVVAEQPKVAGIVRREEWRFEIDDPSQLPREFLMPNEMAIRGYVRSLKGNGHIPGVRIYSTSTIAAGRG